MKYKLSRYNNIFTRGKNTYLWNTLSDALLHMDKEALSFYDTFDGLDHSGEMYFDILKRNRCIVCYDHNELNQVLKDEKISILSPNQEVLHLTIAPGLGCNYKCVYCFEKHRKIPEAMTVETQEKLAGYIIDLAKNNPCLKYVMIRWFGGEPLLYTDAITHISDLIIPYFDQEGIEYYSEIITNGRFLSVENANLLKKCRIKHVQLPIDGMPEYYMSQKRASLSDFEKTVQNVIDTCDILPINIRINISENKKDALDLTSFLLDEKKLDGKIKINISHIRNYDNSECEQEVSAHKSFIDFENRFLNEFLNIKKYSPHSLSVSIPKRRPANCYCICSKNHVIGPRGELYRCEHHLGRNEYSVGNIIDGENNNDVEMKFINYTHPEKCLKCTVFPMCLSGCLNYKLSMACDEYKEHLFDLLLTAYFIGQDTEA